MCPAQGLTRALSNCPCAVLAYDCASSGTGACVEAQNLGQQYSHIGMSSTLKNMQIVGEPTAHKLPGGELLLQFEMSWLAGYKDGVKAMYSHGPYSTHYDEHEQETPPHFTLSKAGVMTMAPAMGE